VSDRDTDTTATSGPSLSPGDRLGPYEIVGALGAGGMGEVYRARDPRLRREVAVKVLRRSLALTPDYVERLAREARAAGGLNHPNIVAVFDVGSEGSLPYVVTELLHGETLRERLDRGPLPYRKALEYGIQIAQALGAAHDKGICHRDVKPANAFITSDGHLKLLDFGLVKVRSPEKPAGDTEESTIDDDDTRPGGIHGTLGYMSPEQVLGETVDHRTDLFALGAVLYEMFGGVPPFRRASPSETARAVLAEEPVDLLERNHALPRSAAALVQRCLEKNKTERYQSARDLAFHLRQLHELAAGPRSPERVARWPTALVAAALSLAALAVLAALFVYQRSPSPSFEQLTFRRGRIGGARFAEGGAVVYSEAREGRPLEVWWQSGPASPQSRLLGYQGSDVLAAGAGKLALSLRRHYVVGARFVGTLAEAPIGEGSPHERTENVEDADWDPSGRDLVVVRSPSAGEESRLEYPAGTLLYKTQGSIRSPRFSRDGRRIAFIEDATGLGERGRVVIVDLEGRPTPLTNDWASASGLAWSASGAEVWFAAGESRTTRALHAVDLARRQRLLLEVPSSLSLWDVGPGGRVLVTRDEERSALVGVPPGETAERDLSWFDTSSLADLSADGSLLLFDDRFGIYIRRTDGSPPVYLGSAGSADDISLDGKHVLATSASGDQLVVLPAGPGEPLPLEKHGFISYRGSLWFPDGQRILFNGTKQQGSLRSYVQDLPNGTPTALTPENAWVLAISPDGEWAAAIGPGQGVSLYPVKGGAARPLPASLPGDRPVAWSSDGRWLWVFRRGEVPAEVSQLELATGQRQLWKKLRPPDASGVYSINDFKMAADGRAYFYSYKRVLSQLYTIDGLR
jgi:serine/threonine protein kinase